MMLSPPREKNSGPSTLLHTFALIFTALTMVFALFSLILINRLSTLQTHFLTAKEDSITSDAATIQGMEAKLKTAMDKLETEQKNLKEEKAAAERVSRQLAGVLKDFEKAKADLSTANETISKLKSTVPTQLPQTAATPEPETPPIVAPSMGTVLSQDPPPQSVPEKNQSSMALPVPVQLPATTAPEPSASQAPSLPAKTPETQAGTPPPHPTAAPLPPESTPPAAQETIADSPKAPPPTTAPPGD